ncbi:EamA family transporter [Duganella sp. BJB488]|uniref:EamA family transporter n=1 Tax=unclassified Duganella TaxID=2636909 RepID=UPI000E350F8E|nr:MULTISPECIES: EamA family transporter [unclassified Duganella]RFP16939.1 EamA family transporter [Duganella sp. BJB489]RFP20641.1 EamA family transporter [Duganella sp. BJB488]RFP32305.1 EamA family transporter [Duganella sp. BJB480]
MSATSTSSFSTRDLISALFVVLIWGTNFVAMKVGLRHLTPFQMGAARYVFAVLPLILFIRPPKLPAKWIIAYGLCQGVGQFGLLFLSLRIGMSAALASVILQTQVFFTAFFGFALLHERASRQLQAGLLLAAVGLVCFGMNYVQPGHAGGTTAGGFVLCLAAAAMWAASNIVVRRAQQATPQFDVVGFMVWCSLVPILPFVGLSLAFDDPATRWSWTSAPLDTWISAAYLGWMATILGYAMWTRLLKRHPVNRVAPFSLGVPVVGISAGMIALGDVITGWQWAGIALIVASLICTMFGGRWLGRRS